MAIKNFEMPTKSRFWLPFNDWIVSVIWCTVVITQNVIHFVNYILLHCMLNHILCSDIRWHKKIFKYQYQQASESVYNQEDSELRPKSYHHVNADHHQSIY